MISVTAGMNGCVAKPVRKSELVGAIMRALQDTRADAANAGPGTNAAAEPPVFDRARYDAMVEELGEDGVRELMDIFLDETDRRIALLRKLSGETDRVKIAREAHSLKSDAGALGLAQLAELASALERDAPRMAEAEYLAALDRLAPAFAAGREKLPRQVASAA